MSKTISFRFKNTPSDQAFANRLLESEREKLGYVSAEQSVQLTGDLDLPCTCPKNSLGFVMVKAHDCPEHGTPRR